jgi:hypothetical protein
LWAGFEELVKEVLLPMAQLGIVHPDIRPGFDTTFNILCKMDEGDEKASLKLIDFESLVLVNRWNAPEGDGRYIRFESNWDATTFLWWQCVCLAYSWKNELDSNALIKGYHFVDLVMDIYGPQNIAWMKELGASATDVMDKNCVERTLSKLARLFEK